MKTDGTIHIAAGRRVAAMQLGWNVGKANELLAVVLSREHPNGDL
jgi:hypothetical protein